MQLYLAVTPDKLREASYYTDRLAHTAYQVDREGRLVRRDLLVRTHGGIMVLGDGECGVIRDPGALCREVWRECGNRGYGGVLADFEGPVTEDRAAFLEALSRVLTRNRRVLYVPEAYGGRVAQATVVICTALSGGNLRQRLEECGRRYGAGRLGLDLQRLRMSFPLPCPPGEGEPLSSGALEELLERKGNSVFYSHDLCAKYFTITENGSSRFVMFDDGDTIRRKVQLGQDLGIRTGFLMYPEVEDILGQLFSQRR